MTVLSEEGGSEESGPPTFFGKSMSLLCISSKLFMCLVQEIQFSYENPFDGSAFLDSTRAYLKTQLFTILHVLIPVHNTDSSAIAREKLLCLGVNNCYDWGDSNSLPCKSSA